MKGAPLPPGTVGSSAMHQAIEAATAAEGTFVLSAGHHISFSIGSPAKLTYVLQGPASLQLHFSMKAAARVGGT